MNSNELVDMKINVKIKLSVLWATVMFLYIYADIVGFFGPGHIESIMAGVVEGFQITQVWMLGVITLMAIPTLMVFLSLTLNAKANRWTNIIVGGLHVCLALFMALPIGTVWAFFIFASLLEAVLLSFIVWYAWKWPTQEG